MSIQFDTPDWNSYSEGVVKEQMAMVDHCRLLLKELERNSDIPQYIRANICQFRAETLGDDSDA